MFTNLIENEKKLRRALVRQSREEGRKEGVDIAVGIIGALAQGEPIDEIASRYDISADKVREIQSLLSRLPPMPKS